MGAFPLLEISGQTLLLGSQGACQEELVTGWMLLAGLRKAEPWEDGVAGGYPASLLSVPDKKTTVVPVMCGFTFCGFSSPWSTMVQKY